MDMILINLEKDFDNLDYKIFLNKMKCMGFSDKTIKCFHPYLRNIVFFVSIGTVFSEAGTRNWVGAFVVIAVLNPDETSIFYQDSEITKMEIFWMKNLQVYEICLLIISYQFILVKINAFFSLRIKTYLRLTKYMITIE